MGIGSITDYSAYLQNYRIPNIPVVSVDEIRRQEQAAKETGMPDQTAQVSHESLSIQRPERKDAALEDISITFNKSDDFGYIGKDSDIRSLDVEKAIDDMKKDRILQQYQYFVGNSRSIQAESMDGVVFQKL